MNRAFVILCILLPAFHALIDPRPAEAASLPSGPSPRADSEIDFIRDIQPILAGHCHACHGPEKQKAGLRLDLKKNALEGGDSGPVIVPGASNGSKLIQLVTKADGTSIMPPPDSAQRALTQADISQLQRWIDEGAPWPDIPVSQTVKSSHWSFHPPVRPDVPPVGNSRWMRNEIDAFVLARLESENLAPSPQADRSTLIRRLSLDLLGLPPKPSEVEAFLADSSPDAYEKVVDLFLASPHFGERWGRHWLDLARYADSDGYEKDNPRPYAYLYRDWVINAVNADIPFDRFSTEQLAGDLLPRASTNQITATGFHRQTLTNTEGGVDQEEFRSKATVDRVSTTASVWLGVTLNCAECHTHKYDPFTQREFYQFYAFFNNASETNLPAPQPDEWAAYVTAKTAWDARNDELTGAISDYFEGPGASRFAAWLEEARRPGTTWKILEPLRLTAAQGTTLTSEPDGTVIASGEKPPKETYKVETGPGPDVITGIRLEVLPPPDGKQGGSGRADDGNFVLTRFEVQLRIPGHDPKPVKLGHPLADYSQPDFDVANARLGLSTTGWAVGGDVSRPHTALFPVDEPLRVPHDGRLVFLLDHQYGNGFTLGRFRLSATSDPPPLRLDMAPPPVAALLRKESAQRTPEDVRQLRAHFLRQVDETGGKLQQALDEHAKKSPKAPATFIAALAEEPDGRTTRVHRRGNFLDPGVEVQPDTPSVLHPFRPRGDRGDRLDLARWLFAPENPLTARVSVNHVWNKLFGSGLVTSMDDFGTQGEPPSHPDLLDWLATEYPRLGWSRKALIRLMVTSATYRQQSTPRADLHVRDPQNRLLARQNRLRLEAETVRDSFLAASGLLHDAVGGPSIRPPLPADIAALGYADSVKWQESPGAAKNRRGLYIFFQRTVPYPMLTTFDAPDSNATCTRRERSNTPIQALTLLNDPVFVECSQALGRRMAGFRAPDPALKIRHGFRQCLARDPKPAELARLVELYESQRNLLDRNPGSAAAIAAEATDEPRVKETAALIAVGRVILNLDEFVTRD